MRLGATSVLSAGAKVFIDPTGEALRKAADVNLGEAEWTYSAAAYLNLLLCPWRPLPY